MKKAFLLVTILMISVISTACINNFAVQELNNKAKGYLDKGDYQNAISRLKSSIDLDSTILETHYNLGIAYTEAEDYENAIETFQDAIKLNPNFADTYYSLAVAQENFAKSLIDGSFYKNDDKNDDKDDDKDEINNIHPKKPVAADREDEEKPYKISDDDKIRVAQCFEDAIKSYQDYLAKSSKAKDKADVEGKISALEGDVAKYSAQ